MAGTDGAAQGAGEQEMRTEMGIPEIGESEKLIQSYAIRISAIEPKEAEDFWRMCMSYAKQFPETEFWSVVHFVMTAPEATRSAL